MTPIVSYSHGSRSRLSHRDVERFPDDTLFHRIGRVVARAECLPRKELFESWEVARRIRRRFRGSRIVDLACGHGLVAMILMLLDDTSPMALAADPRLPPSARRLLAAIEAEWPRIIGRIELLARAIGEVELKGADLVVSAHACGALTDRVLDRAISVRAKVAVLPCCHSATECDLGGLGGWLDSSLAIDVTRTARLRAEGYRVHALQIPSDITPKNRLLVAEPSSPLSRVP